MIERDQLERWIGQIIHCVKREKFTNLNEFERRMDEFERSMVNSHVDRSQETFL